VTDATKADEIALKIEADIASGAIPAGAVLRQGRLAEQFGVSRTPIREALRLLAAEGIVAFSPNRGVRVRGTGDEELTEAFRIRADLEGLAVELATPRFTPEALAALTAAEQRYAELTHELVEQRRERDRAALAVHWLRANDAFHSVIVGAAGSPLLTRLLAGVHRQFTGQALWAGDRRALQRIVEPGLTEHRLIREAMAIGAALAARAVMERHVIGAGQIVTDLRRGVER
jgi:DNA-binding GntR family transcriptional regulator